MDLLWIKHAGRFAILKIMRRLVIRPGAIGDFIVSLPALECLAGGYLEVWAASQNLPLARFANRTRSIVSTGLDLFGIADPPDRLLEDLRSFDSIVSWYGTNRPEFRRAVAEQGLPFTFFQALPADAAGMHAADFYLEQVRTLVECRSDGIPRLRCRCERGDYAVIHPFSGSPRKNWPLARFRHVSRILERIMPVRWCAGPEDPPLEEPVTRFDNLYDLACWLAGARLYIGNDSGITHLAAAAGAPVMALFGPTDPAVWGPRGDNVRIAQWSPEDLLR